MANFNLEKGKILLVDDEPLNLDLLEQELEAFDLEISTAANGRAALEQITREPPDMIFLDLMMPVLDGYGVLEALQADSAWRHIPVVLVSAADDMASIVRGIEMGAEDFLPKPFEPAILHARLRSGLAKKRLRDREQLYLASLERELEIGRQIQAGFLPQDLPQPEGWEIAAHFAAAREVAGDFYDVFTLPHTRRIGLLVGDVSDKGVGAALFMTLFRSLLRAAVSPDYLAELTAGKLPEDADYLQYSVQLTNSYIARMHGDTGMFATLFFGLLDPQTGSLLYVNAGHEPAILANRSGVTAELRPTGPVVGIIEETMYRVSETTLASGDWLLLFSDGVPDAESVDRVFFSRDRLLELIEPLPETAGQLLYRITGALATHTAGAQQFDDITLLAVRYVSSI